MDHENEREPRRSPSHPELEARGWERDEPTQVLRKTLDEMKANADRAAAQSALAAARARHSRAKLERVCEKIAKTG